MNESASECKRSCSFSLRIFSTLIPKANAWLQENLDIYLVKCETLEKKVTAIDEVTADNCMFLPKNHHAIYVKGLRYIFKTSIASGK